MPARIVSQAWVSHPTVKTLVRKEAAASARCSGEASASTRWMASGSATFCEVRLGPVSRAPSGSSKKAETIVAQRLNCEYAAPCAARSSTARRRFAVSRGMRWSRSSILNRIRKTSRCCDTKVDIDTASHPMIVTTARSAKYSQPMRPMALLTTRTTRTIARTSRNRRRILASLR